MSTNQKLVLPATKSGCAETVLALVPGHHGYLHLFHHHLVAPLRPELVLAPALDIALLSVIKVLLVARETDCVNMIVQIKLSL